MNISVLILLGLSTILNVIVPNSGTATVTPLIAAMTDAHAAVGFVGFYFFMSAMTRFVVFRRHVQWPFVKKLLPISMIGSVIGAYALFTISEILLLSLLAISTVYFIVKKVSRSQTQQKENIVSRFGAAVVGLFSGFLQGTGLAGSDIRNNYLYARGLSIVQVHGTTSMIGGINFFLATIVRLSFGKIAFPDLSLLLIILPFMIVGTMIGKRMMMKIPASYQDALVIVAMGIGFVLVLQKVITLSV